MELFIMTGGGFVFVLFLSEFIQNYVWNYMCIYIYVWNYGYPDKISSKKIPLNPVERKPVPTRVLNPNASEANYKPK